MAPIRFNDLLIFFSLFAVIAFAFVFQSSFDWRGRATDTPAIITVDTSVVGDEIDISFYHSFAQGGAEPTDMLAPIVSQIKTLRPNMIRIDHIYDGYGVVSTSGSELTYDWTKLDSVVDSIVKAGATPLLSLSYMPPSIAMDGVVIHAPTDWNLWKQVVAETIRHYSGAKAINAMRYEVWNEPDLDQFGGWKYYGNKII